MTEIVLVEHGWTVVEGSAGSAEALAALFEPMHVGLGTTLAGYREQPPGELLKTVSEHRSVMFVENVAAYLDDPIRSHTDDAATTLASR